ncbi:M20 metallopeptidase family protein [Sphingobacterium kyonggiense]
MGITEDQKELDFLVTDAIKHRRYLHQNPELSFQEFNTSAYIQNCLKEMGIPFHLVGKTAVVGILDGTQGKDNPNTVVLRADMDALPILEKNEVSYKSLNEGVMHACGHDFHSSNLLAVGQYLRNRLSAFSGRVLLLFQPAEERVPGGAIEIIESNILNDLSGSILGVLGLHVSPRLPLGSIGICPGPFMASSDEIYLTIKGRGGHAAEPHLAIDPIMIAVQLLTSLQQIISRQANPNTPSVLTFGKIQGLGAANVIPDEVNLEGTFRTMDEHWRKEALDRIERLIHEIPASFGASVDLDIKRGYPVLKNDPILAQKLKKFWEEKYSRLQVVDQDIWMAAEDFAYYTHQYPSLFVLLGTNNGDSSTAFGLHNPQFNLDEEAFYASIPAMANAALYLLLIENG